MIGLVVATHAGLAQELIASATMITGEIALCEAVSFHPDDPPDQFVQRIGDALARVAANGAIIMTDMFGGTPSNTSLSFLEEGRIEVITGINMPMLVEFCYRRERMSLTELVPSLIKSGRESILSAGEFLKK